jgi:hypothetical protein
MVDRRPSKLQRAPGGRFKWARYLEASCWVSRAQSLPPPWQVRGALEGHRASIARDLGELEDIMAAAVKDIRSGLVAERKDLFDALHSHGRDAATAAAHLGAQLQVGLKGTRTELAALKQGGPPSAPLSLSASLRKKKSYGLSRMAPMYPLVCALLFLNLKGLSGAGRPTLADGDEQRGDESVDGHADGGAGGGGG